MERFVLSQFEEFRRMSSREAANSEPTMIVSIY